jgi:hypothetical protein
MSRPQSQVLGEHHTSCVPRHLYELVTIKSARSTVMKAPGDRIGYVASAVVEQGERGIHDAIA